MRREAPPLALLALLAGCHPSPSHEPHGVLDRAFGSGGLVVDDLGAGADGANAVLVQSDGKLLLGGQSQNLAAPNEHDFAIARLLADGSVDPTFTPVATDAGSQDDEILSVAELPDGRIRAVGLVTSNGRAVLVLAGYTATGSSDASFGLGGRAATALGTSQDGVARPLAMQPDGKIVLVGSRRGVTSDFAVARFLPDGSPDTAFGTGGEVDTDFSSAVDSGYAVAIDPQGRILVAGGIEDLKIARYLSDGTLDASFGTSGRIDLNYLGGLETGRALALRPDGSFLVLVTDNNGGGIDMIVARFDEGGNPDATLGTAGSIHFQFASQFVGATDLAEQPDGRIVVAGTHYDLDYDFEVERFLPDGRADVSFGDGGSVLTDFGASDYGVSMALQPDGRIVVAGSATGDFSKDFAIARYLP
jgi:uncharacterized delta-60 repeat protein